MSNEGTEWTPYGLEPIRQAHLRKRRILGALAALAVLLLAFTFVETTKSTSLSLSANGRELSGGVTIPEPEKSEAKDYVTVSLEPGRVSRAEAGNEVGGEQVERNSMPQASRASPVPWKLWALQLFPWLLAGLVAYLLAKRRGKHDEINFGVYKGAMPLEMMTAQHESAIFTKRWARTSVFGKRRLDHLPPEVAGASEEA